MRRRTGSPQQSARTRTQPECAPPWCCRLTAKQRPVNRREHSTAFGRRCAGRPSPRRRRADCARRGGGRSAPSPAAWRFRQATRTVVVVEGDADGLGIEVTDSGRAAREWFRRFAGIPSPHWQRCFRGAPQFYRGSGGRRSGRSASGMQIESNRKSRVRTVERLARRKEHDRAGDDEPADYERAAGVRVWRSEFGGGLSRPAPSYSDWGPRLAFAKLSVRNYDVSRASQVPCYYVYRPTAVRWPSPGGAPALMQSVCIRTEGCGALR